MIAKTENIVQSKRRVITIFALFPWLSRLAFAGSNILTIPPARAWKWDVCKENNVIVKEFEVTSLNDAYYFEIGFAGLDAATSDGRINNNSDQSWRSLFGEYKTGLGFTGPLQKWMGDSNVSHMTRIQDAPIILISDIIKLGSSTSEGTVIKKLGNSGIVVPVQIKIERIMADGSCDLIFDRPIETAGIESGGNIMTRPILSVRLTQGSYKVTAQPLKNNPPLPEGVATYLFIHRLIPK